MGVLEGVARVYLRDIIHDHGIVHATLSDCRLASNKYDFFSIFVSVLTINFVHTGPSQTTRIRQRQGQQRMGQRASRHNTHAHRRRTCLHHVGFFETGKEI